MTDQDQNTTPDTPETITIESVPQMAFAVSNWFDNAHGQLHQALNVPDGQPMSVQLEDNGPMEDVVLTGDMLKGFKAGLIVAASIFGQLPFGPAEAPSDDAAPAQ